MTRARRPFAGGIVPSLVLGLALAVSACAAYERADQAKKVQSQMVGMRKDQVRACAGPPRRRQVRDESEVWIYEVGDDDVRRGPGPPAADTGSFGVPSPSRTIPRRYCVARVFIRNGRVSRVTYSGMTGGVFSRGEQCAFVLGSCLR